MKQETTHRRPTIAVCVKAFVDAGVDPASIVIDRKNDRVFVKEGVGDTIDHKTGLDTSWQ